MYNILPFKAPQPTPSTKRLAEVGQIWIENGPAGLWRVQEIKVIGPNVDGRWPAVIRDVLIQPIGEQPEMSPRATAARRRVRWIRERNLLCNFERPAEHARTLAQLRVMVPPEWHGGFGLDDAKGGELLGARPSEAPPLPTRKALAYLMLGNGRARILVRLAPDGRMGIEDRDTLPLMPLQTWKIVADAYGGLTGRDDQICVSGGGFRVLLERIAGKFHLEIRGRRIQLANNVARALFTMVREAEEKGLYPY